MFREIPKYSRFVATLIGTTIDAYESMTALANSDQKQQIYLSHNTETKKQQ